MARIASTVLVVALLAATASAFALTEGLKLELSPVTGPIRIAKVFSPVCECEREVATIGFRLREPDVLDVAIVDAQRNVVATVARGVRRPAGDATFEWDGRADDGDVVPEGEYAPRVHLRRAHYTITFPNPIRVDVTAPVIETVDVQPRVISPDGDGRADFATIRYRFSEDARALLFVDGERRGLARPRVEGKLTWSGRHEGSALPAATYQLTMAASDAAGNTSRRTDPVPVRIRYIALGRARVDVVAGGTFAIRVSADARVVLWRLGGRSGTTAPGTVRLRAPLQKGRFTLVVSAKGRSARAAVFVRERPSGVGSTEPSGAEAPAAPAPERG